MRCTALLLLLLSFPLSAGDAVRVAVAANFKPTLERISARFEAATGQRVILSSASTGVLHNQILHGAPFHIFFAADRQSPARLYAENVGGQPFCYALGRLVLAGESGDLAQLADPRRSLAIANPATAPYGRAALEVLAREEFRPGDQRKLVRGNNVAQAYQFWHSGAVDQALLPLALFPGGTAIPGTWHRVLEQYAIVIERNAAVDAYLKWIRSDTVRSMITEAGYHPCP